jgi:hypothetical protein
VRPRISLVPPPSPRAKPLGRGARRLVAVELEGRKMAARHLAAAVERDGAYGALAAALNVSENYLRACADEDAPQDLGLGKVCAIFLAGYKVVAIGLLRDMQRAMEDRAVRLGLAPREHALRMLEALGVFAIATEGTDADAQLRALDDVQRRVDEARRDLAKRVA